MLADLIKTEREALGLSQEALAFKAHTTQATISRIEAGEFHPRARLARDLAVALKIAPERVLLMVADTAPVRAAS